MGSRRPLQPLSPTRRKVMIGLVVAWAVVFVAAMVQVAKGDTFMIVLAGGAAVQLIVWPYEIRRRSDPARTAGWGRPQGYRDQE